MTRPLDPETLVYGLTTAGDPQVSPDGTRVLYARGTVDRGSKQAVSQLWLADVAGQSTRQLTFAQERDRGARWSPDGRQIAFVSSRVKRSGIFVLPVDGPGEARELTHHNRDVGYLAWSPDGRSLAYTVAFDPENPDEADPPDGAAPRVRVTRRIDYKQDGLGYLGDLRRQVFVVDVASGERRRFTTDDDNPLDYDFPQWSPDGRTLAVLVSRLNGMCSQLGLIDVATGAARLVGPERGAIGTWAWSPDGDRILLAADPDLTPQLDLFVYTAATGELRRLTDDLPCLPDSGFPNVNPPALPVWLDGSHALFHAFRAGASGLYGVDADTGKVEPVVTWPALNVGLSADAARRYFAQARASLAEVGEISVFDRESGQTSIITRSNAALFEDAPPARWEKLSVSRGERTFDAWLLKPPDFDPAKRYPVVLDVHGGPHGYYGFGFNPVQQCLATGGFLVVFANPRGSGSYGREFAQLVQRDWGGEDFLDLMAIVDAVVARPEADAERLGIWGYSYGGYMTAWTIGHTDRFKAAVCGAPCFDLESMYGTSDISHLFGEIQWGDAPHANREGYAAHSPSTFAHLAKTPTLIVHGEADERCPIGQGEQMFVALKKAGCEVEFARYPGDFHGFLRTGPAEHRADLLSRVLGWFKGHLGEPA